MKRWIALFLILSLTLALFCGCKSGEKEDFSAESEGLIDVENEPEQKDETEKEPEKETEKTPDEEKKEPEPAHSKTRFIESSRFLSSSETRRDSFIFWMDLLNVQSSSFAEESHSSVLSGYFT